VFPLKACRRLEMKTMNSISGTTASLPPTFSLNVYGGAARRLDKELAPKPSDERARELAAKTRGQT